MPEETGTETTRSDALNADESLSSDAADGAAVAAAEEQGADNGAEQNPEDLKVVVSIKGGRATIGVQGTSSDPHIESFEGQDLSGLAQEVPAVVERARAKWEDEPKHPVHARPAPAAPVRRRARREQGAAQAPTTEEGADQQQPETLRLF